MTISRTDPSADPHQRWARLQEVLRVLAQPRQEDRKTGWLALERQRRMQEADKRTAEETKREFQKEKAEILAPIWAKSQLGRMAELFGGGDAGRDVAAFVLEVQRDLPFGSLTGKLGSLQLKPDHTESNPVKPDHTG